MIVAPRSSGVKLLAGLVLAPAVALAITLLLLIASAPAAQPAPSQTARQLATTLGCAACHSGIPTDRDPRDMGPSLDSAGQRHSPAYILAYLQHPERWTQPRKGQARMPDFHLDEREALAVALFLVPGNGASSAPRPNLLDPERDEQERRFAQIRKANPAVTPDMGRTIFLSQNCAGCHRLSSIQPWQNGPDLTRESARVRPEWLRGYLAAPTPVRPFGTRPGSGSRMPDFRLTVAEADSMASFLSRAPGRSSESVGESLSPFAMAKAQALIRDKLPCLGCHQLGDTGGRIGPNLSHARRRLTAAFVRAMIEDPQRAVPGSMMPRVPMTRATLDLISRFLLQRPETPLDTSYPSLVTTPLVLPSSESGTASYVYSSYCAACHGVAGKGDGYNALYLPVPPAAHASSASMSRRPDDTIFDGIHAGAYILGRSNRMPGFGQTLSRTQIQGLVRYIRMLCDCEGPSWSRDGSASR